MSQIHKHSIPANIAEHTLINPQMYRELYQRSVHLWINARLATPKAFGPNTEKLLIG